MSRKSLGILGVAAMYVASCTTILGNDFEIAETSSGGNAAAGGEGATTTTANGRTGGDVTSAGGVAPGMENCTNGVDDDGDGDPDCADDDCMAYHCAADVPPTWTGPIAWAEFPFGDPAPTCPSAFGEEVHNGVTGLGADPVTCDACTCNAVNPTCTPAPVAIYSQAGCADMFPIADNNIIGGCDQMNTVGGTAKVRIGQPTAAVSCSQGGGGIATTPPHRWTAASRSCHYDGARGGGCMDEQICVPRPGGGAFAERQCIVKAGDNECPAPFLDRHLYSDDAQDVDDGRSCTACTCEQASASCSISTEFYTSSNCSGNPAFTVANNGNCNNSNTNGTYARAVVTGAPSGTCQVQTDAEPQGEVTARGPFTTVCCIP